MSILSPVINRVANYFGYVRATPEQQALHEHRESIYAANELLYDNGVYRTRTNGGALEDVLKTYIGAAYTNSNLYPIYPFFMPFAEIVDCYGNVMPGTWGEQIKPAAQFDGKPINAKLGAALTKVWRDSNLDTDKGTIIRHAANLGTVGMRIVATKAEKDKPARSVIAYDHPSRLFNFEEDAQGNVTAVVLKYQKQVNRGTLADPDFETVEVVEQIDKDEFSLKWDGLEQIEDADRAGLSFSAFVATI